MRVTIAALGALALLAACSSSGASDTTPTIPPGSADASGWAKVSAAQVRSIAEKLDKTMPGGCTGFKLANRAQYLAGQKRVGKPFPDAVGQCTSLTEDLEISVFPSNAVRDDFVSNRHDKICEISKKNNIGLPGLYWVVGGNWSIQPDSEGVSRRVAQAINGKYEPTGCNGTNPGWDPAAVATLQPFASKLQAKKLGCVDYLLQDRDLVSHTVPFNSIGTPAGSANCTLTDGATIVLSAYNGLPATKTEQLIRGELGRECVGSGDVRIVRVGDVALFASNPAIADRLKSAVGGSIDPLNCQKLLKKK